MPIVTKVGKCQGCGVKVREEREFKPQIDMFNPEPKTWLSGPVVAEVKAFRDEPIYCGPNYCISSVSLV